MKQAQVKAALVSALSDNQNEICAHISSVYEEGRSSGIEAAFQRAFEAQFDGLDKNGNTKPEDVGSRNHYPGRMQGRIDCYFPALQCAFEFKAIRLPRLLHTGLKNQRYDYGQLLVDYLRMARAKKLASAYVIAFLYGPLVADAKSSRDLYRTFHNTMFLDAYISRTCDLDEEREVFEHDALNELGWLKPCPTAAYPAEQVFAVKVGQLGAVCISSTSSD